MCHTTNNSCITVIWAYMPCANTYSNLHKCKLLMTCSHTQPCTNEALVDINGRICTQEMKSNVLVSGGRWGVSAKRLLKKQLIKP